MGLQHAPGSKQRKIRAKNKSCEVSTWKKGATGQQGWHKLKVPRFMFSLQRNVFHAFSYARKQKREEGRKREHKGMNEECYMLSSECIF